VDNSHWPSFPKKVGYDGVQMMVDMFLPPAMRDRVMKLYSVGIASPKETVENENSPKKWSNPLESALPKAPNMTIYCFYGFKKTTELGYIYKSVDDDPNSLLKNGSIASSDVDEIKVPIIIDQAKSDPSIDLLNGVLHTEGDGTVPLLSLGFMGRHGWSKLCHLNPSRIQVVTKEFEHEPSISLVDLRGGPKTGDHVDILGNYELTLDILKIASNYRFISERKSGPLPQNRILSNIDTLSETPLKNIQKFYSTSGV
jgi:phospholipid:diacylglycerol acyltransferase